MQFDSYDQLLDQLDRLLHRLPGARDHRQGLPAALAPYLTRHKRLPRQPDRYPQAWTEYRLLGMLALTGWSLRWALVQAEADLACVTPRSGKMLRACAHLERAGLWETASIAGRKRITLVRLSGRGRTLLEASGVEPVESEWERIERLHRGESEGQRKHTALLCTAAFHARLHGYQTQVCPLTADGTEPDLQLVRGDHTLFVEVQRKSGTPWNRLGKWQNQLRLQGVVALFTETVADRERYVQEMRRAGIGTILATDLQSLYTQTSPDLWITRLPPDLLENLQP